MVVFIVLALIVLAIVTACAIAKLVRENREEHSAYDAACRNWDNRVKELGFSAAGKPVVYRKYSNSDNFYPVYVWVENGRLYSIIAAPTWETRKATAYTYPENIKKSYFSNIRKIYRTGSQGSYIQKDFSHSEGLKKRSDMTTGLESLYYMKKSRDAAKHAPTQTVTYDNRQTIIEADNGPFKFRIDAYDVFKRLVPDKC